MSASSRVCSRRERWRWGGDKTKATKTYEDFLALWKDADRDLAILKQAQNEYATLQ